MPPSTEAIWKNLGSDLRRFIRRRVSDDHAADDLLQETFVRIHRNLGRLEEAERLSAWVYRIARNVIHDYHRAAAKSFVTLANIDVVDEAQDQSEDGCCTSDWLHDMIGSLPPGYGQALRLAEMEGLPQQQVADRLGVTLSGAKSRIQRGRAMLKKVLDQCCSFQFDRRGNLDCDLKPDQKLCRACHCDGAAGDSSCDPPRLASAD